jgi:hypothetical protein
LHVTDSAAQFEVLGALGSELVAVGSVPGAHVEGGLEFIRMSHLEGITHGDGEFFAESFVGCFFVGGVVEGVAEAGVLFFEVFGAFCGGKG